MAESTTSFGGTSSAATGQRPGESLGDRVGNALDRGRSGIADSASTARDNLSGDVAQLQQDIAAIKETLSKFASQAGGEAMKTVQNVGAAVATQVSGAAAAATSQAKTVVSEVENMARTNPLATVGASVLVGIVIGLLSRGGRS